ncbi:MAG TPA: Fe-S protein assembly co-chaperone HscB [Candidatus Binatia bacterium]|nr:Fe-S protein assembly co-chaperone HscB [Candidatus Binatia bacterium]
MAPIEHTQQPADNGILVASPSRSTKVNCWSCGDMRAAHFCQQCGKVQPPAPVDYFTFFGLPYRLNLDTAKLEREFYSLSRHLHPDINAISSPQEQQWSLEKSSQLNDAYRTLKDPVARTEYLLRLQGVHLEEQSKTATEEARRTGQAKKQAVPPDLLEQVFELNMQLEEARMNRKMGEPDRSLELELQDSRKRLREKYDSMMDELRRIWNEWDAMVERAEQGGNVLEEDRLAVRDKMLDLLNRRSYLRNLLRDIDEVLE